MEERIRPEGAVMPEPGTANGQTTDRPVGVQPAYTAKPAQPFRASRLQLGAAVYSYLLGWFYFCGLVQGAPLMPFQLARGRNEPGHAGGVLCAVFRRRGILSAPGGP